MNGQARQRFVAVVLLAAMLAVFGMAAQAESPVHSDAAGVHAVTMAALPAPALPNPHGAPDIPLAEEDPAAELTPPEVPAADQHAAFATQPRAHRQPSADRAPPA